jgi:signal transduction histidine kinase/ActR/RegA family two-component response regulator
MTALARRLFSADIWTPALEKYGGVTHLTVSLFDASGQLAYGPIHSTPLVDLFAGVSYDPGLIADCVQRCLQGKTQRPILSSHASGLAVVGTPLRLNGDIVGAAVGGYHLRTFPPTIAVERLAREAQIALPILWGVVQQEIPLSTAQFCGQGELLQVLGDTILREMERTWQYEDAAQQLRKTAEDLRAASAAKDEFLAVLSHELRTPLSPILLWARMLKLSPDPARIVQAAEVIERNAQLQAKLIDDLLELTRITRGNVALDIHPIDLNEAVRTALEAYVDSARVKGVNLEVLESPVSLPIKADPVRLQQVLRNVLSNAMKFTPQGGRITIAVEARDNHSVVTVRDTGAGITPDFLPYVFDIFRQQERGTRRAHEGLGIGLAVVKHLTELQGGRVSIASAGQGLGTEVSIEFPLSVDSEAISGAETQDAGGARRDLKGLRILVVEDMPDTREAMGLILQRLGAEVLVADDGMKALAIIEAADPDLVLCDLRMPRMDGFEFMRALRVRPNDSHPPVVAVSGLASPADHARTHGEGFVGHLSKPFDDSGILAAVNEAMLNQVRKH